MRGGEGRGRLYTGYGTLLFQLVYDIDFINWWKAIKVMKERKKEKKKAPTIYESNKNMLQVEHTMLIGNMSRQWTSHSLLMLFCYY